MQAMQGLNVVRGYSRLKQKMHLYCVSESLKVGY